VAAEHIVNVFGMDTLDVLNNHPERLVEVPGMGARRAESIAVAWAERRSLQEMMTFLQSQQLPVALAARIVKKYGQAAANVVRQQPYRLAAEVYGISFEVVDDLAARVGRDRLARFRDTDWNKEWLYVPQGETVHLTDQQKEAARAALTERVAVITGGPGTGKTTTLRSIVQRLRANEKTAVLAAPTGRA